MRPIKQASSSLAIVFLFLVLLALTGCTRSYDVQGRVVGFGDDGRTLIIEHEAVPGLMPAMTMPFKAVDAADVPPLDQGQAVRFTLTLGRDSSWITDIEVLPDDAVARHPAGDSLPAPTSASTSASPILAPGDTLPDFTLVDQDSTLLQRADLLGRPLLLTFIYTRCPLPDYCPRMSAQFQQLQQRLTDRYGDAVRQLSISFDPAYDTPSVLRDYAARYTDDIEQWSFATGTPEEIGRLAEAFGVFYSDEDTEIIHNLATALVDAEGRVVHVWRGNQWTVEDVTAAVERLDPPARPPAS